MKRVISWLLDLLYPPKCVICRRLLAAGERLMGVIRRNEGGANKDLAKFADQINALCDKWDR